VGVFRSYFILKKCEVTINGCVPSLLRMCLDRIKNSVKIEKLRIVNQNSKKNYDFSVSARIVKR
jgi:hypothetical protein